MTQNELIEILANELCVSKFFVKYINDLELLCILTDFSRKESNVDFEYVNILMSLENKFNIDLGDAPSNLNELLYYINERILNE